jgi:hypothetical protein
VNLYDRHSLRRELRGPGFLATGFGWLLPGGPAVDIDFTNSLYYGISPSSLITTRASTGYADNTSGVWASFASNTARVTNKGLLTEEARTNVALWCRDLTNAAWTKTNVTAALNQAGIDGTTNAASSITATAASGTVLQVVTLASSARFQSAFVKRITGAGTLEMTTDGGTTWTVVAVTAAWARVTIPTQTVVNPSLGFRIATSGDAFAIDFVQNENGIFATSPILTTTVATARAADSIALPASIIPQGTPVTLFGQAIPLAPITYAGQQNLIMFDDGASTNRIGIRRGSADGLARAVSTVANVTSTPAAAVAWAQNARAKLIAAFATSDQAMSFNGAAVVTGAAAIPGAGVLTAGKLGDASAPASWDGYIERMTIFNSRIANAQLQSLTA